uniref:CRM domain-containing protein n=1 Tax=Coccolithus braarudii TaxID=221442 RepID=A0A7S0L1Y6_9EUKA|mmetsp:Transcript_15812/g.34344  ORF Transcript_15812/g.34344 Transcript_15812/m.34344 type:complete len:158 (+) Transcript_15812:14-487(+)
MSVRLVSLCFALALWASEARSLAAIRPSPRRIPLSADVRSVQRAGVPFLCLDVHALTGKQKRHLRAVAGRLERDKQLRRVQVTDPERSISELDLQLASAELVRCKFLTVEHKSEAAEMANAMAARVDATVAQVLGHTALFYRPSIKHLIELPSVGIS